METGKKSTKEDKIENNVENKSEKPLEQGIEVANALTAEEMLKKIEPLINLASQPDMIDYLAMLSNRKRRMFNNLYIGMAKGLGTAIGFTILGAILIVALSYVVDLNIPIIGDFIAEIVRIVQLNLK